MVNRRIPEETNFDEYKLLRPTKTDTVLNEDGSVKTVSKTATTMSVVNAEEAKGVDAGAFLSQNLFEPTDDQLDKINQYTARKVGRTEVACFTTHSCNDIPDRDDDRFNTKAVKGFATLPAPYSPNGKSFMVGHDYTKLAVGRIFDSNSAAFKTPDGNKATKLQNDVYIPRIASTKDFLDNQEFGINWAVSVGVMLGASKCFVGKAHDWGWSPWFCSAGHEKGLSYDPESSSTDDYGWPTPVSDSSSKGVKCIRDLDEAKDMYELSQVFLGAQYYAALEKDPSFTGVIKGANPASKYVMGIGSTKLSSLNIPRLPEVFRESAKSHNLKEQDGTFTTKDDKDLLWSFTPGRDAEPMLLGKASISNRMTYSDMKSKLSEFDDEVSKLKKAIQDNTLEAKDTDAVAAVVPKLSALLTSLDAALTSQDMDLASGIMDQVNDAMDELYDALYGSDPDSDADDDINDQKSAKDKAPTRKSKDTTSSKSVILKALSASNLDQEVYDRLSETVQSSSDTYDDQVSNLIRSVSAELKLSSDMAKAGASYVKSLEGDVLSWYRKANGDGRTGGVEVSGINKIIEKMTGDVEALEALRDEYKLAAEKRFGSGNTRKSVESDPNDPNDSNLLNKRIESAISNSRDKTNNTVKNIHG